ncbi:MAG: hypothetical protein E7076_05065 [Bacteroidales bacterium]|nr:hypothetical protein [Bacteroidales bacterium]
MTEWKEYKLGEIADVRDGTHDSPKESNNGFPLVTSKNIKNGKIDLSNTYLISKSDYEFVNQRSKVDKWDILFSMIGTIGECAIVKQQPEYAIKNVGLFKTHGDELLAYWIYYYIHSQQAKSEMRACIKGSTQQYISLSDLRNFPIELPIKEKQLEIVSILSSLDDKIDLLHRENATLEQMAETLFRQWFVVERKEEWEEVALGDVVKTTSGGTPSRKISEYYENGTINWVKSKELDGSFISSTEELITEEAVANSSAKMLPEKSVLIAMYGATVGEYGILSKPMTCNQAVCALIPNKNYPYTYLYVWTALMKEDFINLASGAAQQNISQDLIKQQIVCSDLDKIKQYDEMVRGYFEKMENNQKQIQTLIQMRDGLLPRLMSGEVKI